MRKSVTTLLELRRPIPGAHGAKIRKQWPRCRTVFQERFNFRAEPEQRRLEVRAAFQFLARKANRALIPIDVFGQQAGPVRLRRARMPQQFIKVPALAVLLPLDDGRVFFRRDGALGLEYRLLAIAGAG